MNCLIIMCLFLVSAESLSVKDIAKIEGEFRSNRSKASSIKYISLPSERCLSVISDIEKSEDEFCSAHCMELKKGFFDGECIDGTCHCKFDVTAIVSSSEEKPKVESKPGKGKGLNGVKCKNLIRVKGQIGSENHKGCGIHCRLLSPENKDGRCIEGVCLCSEEIIEDVRILKENDDDKQKEKEMEDGKCRHDEECEMACSAPNREPRCMNGICRCRILPPQQVPLEIPGIDREIKKCEHRRRAVSNEICRSHCHGFSRDHGEGQCVNGVCQCGYAVFELMENSTEPEEIQKIPADKFSKMSRKFKGRRRG